MTTKGSKMPNEEPKVTPEDPKTTTEGSKPHEIADVALKYVVVVGASLWVLIVGKDLVEAKKLEGEKNRVEKETIQADWKLAPRAVASISPPIETYTDPWLDDKHCTIASAYRLQNTGEAPIDLSGLNVSVYRVETFLNPTEVVHSISINTRIEKAGSKIFEETLPDSAGRVLPGETYSRSFGYVIEYDKGAMYAVIANPEGTYSLSRDPFDETNRKKLPDKQFRALR
jgi:hypothetical protein